MNDDLIESGFDEATATMSGVGAAAPFNANRFDLSIRYSYNPDPRIRNFNPNATFFTMPPRCAGSRNITDYQGRPVYQNQLAPPDNYYYSPYSWFGSVYARRRAANAVISNKFFGCETRRWR